MPCYNCSQRAPGAMIKTTPAGLCLDCGDIVIQTDTTDLYSQSRWDKYFLEICRAVASKSPCLSRQIGAILVYDKSIISTGYNGPARGYPHCGEDKVIKMCPRKHLGFKSGEGLEHCPASHAEMNCVANAARIGSGTMESTLYMNSLIPCKFCAVILVNAGVKGVVVEEETPYHEMSIDIFEHGLVTVRSFNI